MKKNNQSVAVVRKQLTEALEGVECYLRDLAKAPKDFTNEAELKTFAAKIREMLRSLDTGAVIPIYGMWRIMETWPYQNQLRRKIVEAELAYERLSKG